ncbi:hypothetical protein FHS23_001497 [Prauserella isguenensis]|uniref:DUF6292 domain-containing protein n=1 Tax=Prauserella isguenensis TaxID=1470180 RepID=A0A839RZB2_9PSEU|nr:DUF6292 family protein [Prauserella isguenensis]MBB3050502.1 hypothetical protein [Prauserella isguenensis]
MDTDLDVDSTPALRRALDGYIRAVADELDVPAEGMSFEISDTATAYLGLSTRRPSWPGRDLMLIWDERAGWSVAVETNPAERPVVIARLSDEPVPSPRTVARWVRGILAGPSLPMEPRQQTGAKAVDRHALALRLADYAPD